MRLAPSRNGFSLIELLIAGTVFAIIMTAITGFFISSNKAYQSNAEQIGKEQIVSTAEQVLGYELDLAGYRGTDSTQIASRSFGSSNKTFEATLGTTSDQVTVRYYEDRFTNGSDIAKTATYFAGLDDQNEPFLFRQEGSSTAQAIVEAVTAMKIAAYIEQDGTFSSSLPAAEDLAGIKLELSFSHGETHTMLVHFSSPQAY